MCIRDSFVSGIETRVNKFRVDVAQKITTITTASAIDTPQSNGGSANSSMEQERLNLERENVNRQLRKTKAEAQTKIDTVIEDIERLERKLQADPEEDWTHATDIEIECNMKEIKDWERELSSIRKEAREVVRLVNGNNLADLEEGTRKLE